MGQAFAEWTQSGRSSQRGARKWPQSVRERGAGCTRLGGKRRVGKERLDERTAKRGR